MEQESQVVAVAEPVATEPPPARKQPTRKRKQPPAAPVPIAPAPAPELADDDESDSPEPRPVITTGRNKKKAKTTTVTKKTESNDWTTGIIRTTALITLGGLSFYFQNIYGKKAVAEEVKKPVTVTPPPQQPTAIPSTNNYFTQAKKASIGSSGFNQ